jgi:hypothetical protein
MASKEELQPMEQRPEKRSRKEDGEDYLSGLPVEMQCAIVNYLEPHERLRLRLVNSGLSGPATQDLRVAARLEKVREHGTFLLDMFLIGLAADKR